MYGDYEQPKKELVAVALEDDRVSEAAKKWLKER